MKGTNIHPNCDERWLPRIQLTNKLTDSGKSRKCQLCTIVQRVNPFVRGEKNCSDRWRLNVHSLINTVKWIEGFDIEKKCLSFFPKKSCRSICFVLFFFFKIFIFFFLKAVLCAEIVWFGEFKAFFESFESGCHSKIKSARFVAFEKCSAFRGWFWFSCEKHNQINYTIKWNRSKMYVANQESGVRERKREWDRRKSGRIEGSLQNTGASGKKKQDYIVSQVLGDKQAIESATCTFNLYFLYIPTDWMVWLNDILRHLVETSNESGSRSNHLLMLGLYLFPFVGLLRLLNPENSTKWQDKATKKGQTNEKLCGP